MIQQTVGNPFKNSKQHKFPEEYEVDKYIERVEEELGKYELKLNDSKQLPQISTLLIYPLRCVSIKYSSHILLISLILT